MCLKCFEIMFVTVPKGQCFLNAVSVLSQSDFPKDSDMVESFQCTRTQTSRLVPLDRTVILFTFSMKF